jgi:hypothetical protein
MFYAHIAFSESMCRNTNNTICRECNHALQRKLGMTEENQIILNILSCNENSDKRFLDNSRRAIFGRTPVEE